MSKVVHLSSVVHDQRRDVPSALNAVKARGGREGGWGWREGCSASAFCVGLVYETTADQRSRL